jgi:hypothetical protein
MPPTPLRIAQTTSEVKKQYKQNGPRLPDRQLKQLERGHKLDERAARLRDAERNRKAAKKKREEREEKERAARKQMGVGLATQLIGYSHTQAQLKNGMEAFLGLERRKEEEQRRRDRELTRRLEAIAQTVEKEPWDDDDDTDDMALHLPTSNTAPAEQYVDDDLDDETLLEAHDLLVSDPVEPSAIDAPRPPSALPIQPPPPPPLPPPRTATITPSKTAPTKDDADFVRLHGPLNKAIETVLDKLPEPLIELLSQDISLKLPDWDPAPGLLHKLNPVGLPPHRLRIKVGSVVSLLRDLNTSSQLSKSQHLRILRIENERLECLVLDGQLQGTKALLTRVPFPAKYRNDFQYPFQRTQYPVRVAVDFTSSTVPRGAPRPGFKLPSMPDRVRSSSVTKKLVPPAPSVRPLVNINPTFKLPGMPASKKLDPAPVMLFSNDGWDDFLDSGTQIARELSDISVAAVVPTDRNVIFPATKESLPPLSTQDLDFTMDDLDDTPISASAEPSATKQNRTLVRTTSLPEVTKPTLTHPTPVLDNKILSGTATGSKPHGPTHKTPSSRRLGVGTAILPRKAKQSPKGPMPPPIRREDLTPSQRPASISDRPGLYKRKAPAAPSRNEVKRPCAQATRALKPAVRHSALCDFGISTQDAASFFGDDDDLYSASPPITV